MELEERVAALEARLAALEAAASGAAGAPGAADGDFWALDGLKQQLDGLGAEDGGVLFTGAVRLPPGERYEWQYALATESLLGEESEEWADRAEPLAALGHPVRLRLLREILAGRRTAAELAELAGLGTTGQIYHHLRQLSGTGWLHPAGRGRYEVPPARVVPLLVVLTAARP